MATRKIEILYDLKQLNNENNNAHLLWFPKVRQRSTLSLDGLSDHIAKHGSVYTPDVVQGADITSRTLKTKAQFQQNMIFDKNGVPKRIVDGQLVDYGEDDEEATASSSTIVDDEEVLKAHGTDTISHREVFVDVSAAFLFVSFRRRDWQNIQKE